MGDYRTAFLIVMPIAFIGFAFLLEARKHIEADSAKIFEAVVIAMAAEQAEAAAHAAAQAAAHASGAGHPETGGGDQVALDAGQTDAGGHGAEEPDSPGGAATTDP